MLHIHGRNINEIFPLGVMNMRNRHYAVEQPSRYGDTIEAVSPVVTTTYRPRERVLFCPKRDANPFFHLIESVWILAGRRDVMPLARVLPRMGEFSDDGVFFHAAYGHRLRHPVDQIPLVVHELRKNPDSRRAVLQIWDHNRDLNVNSKDIPCNDLIFLKVREGRLHLRVMCRSNDMLWGAYGANTVQFSMLQEFIANLLGIPVGEMVQYSDSFHVYTSGPGGALWNRVKDISTTAVDPYDFSGDSRMSAPEPFPFIVDPDRTIGRWTSEANAMLDEFMLGNVPGTMKVTHPFLRTIVQPMMQAFLESDPDHLDQRWDWHRAGAAWMARRALRAAS